MSDPDSDPIEGVDFYAAIQAHVLWRLRLEAYIAGTSSEKLSANVVGSDDQCALGKWIYGAGGKHFGKHPNFPALHEAHACFHRSAGEIIRCADSGHSEKARELLKGDYASCSHKVKSNLARLGLELQKE